ncbi:hypothetical protein [Leuconostoc citreum]|uniref:hypothetical protein n=1 Tax=Leuconostoc citreum TaxID=33964 RepID=UPI0032DF569E
MVNKFSSLSLQGKSIGKLTFAGRNLVGANTDTFNSYDLVLFSVTPITKLIIVGISTR